MKKYVENFISAYSSYFVALRVWYATMMALFFIVFWVFVCLKNVKFSIIAGLSFFYFLHQLVTQNKYNAPKRYNTSSISWNTHACSILFVPKDHRLLGFTVRLTYKNLKEETKHTWVPMDNWELEKHTAGTEGVAPYNGNVKKSQTYYVVDSVRNIKGISEYNFSFLTVLRLSYIFWRIQKHYQIYDAEFLEWQCQRLDKSIYYQILNPPFSFEPSPTPTKRVGGMVKTAHATNS